MGNDRHCSRHVKRKKVEKSKEPEKIERVKRENESLTDIQQRTRQLDGRTETEIVRWK